MWKKVTLGAFALLLGLLAIPEKTMADALRGAGYHAPLPFSELVHQADGIISTGDKMGALRDLHDAFSGDCGV